MQLIPDPGRLGCLAGSGSAKKCSNKRLKLSISNMGSSFQGEEKDVFV